MTPELQQMMDEIVATTKKQVRILKFKFLLIALTVATPAYIMLAWDLV